MLSTRRMSVALGMALAPSLYAGTANLLLNGSFEHHVWNGTRTNMSNGLFTSSMDDLTGWGPLSSIDLFERGDAFGLDPIEGDWHIALQSLPIFDAFSFHLAEPMVAGEEYDLSFWATRHSALSSLSGRIQIGVSTEPDGVQQVVHLTEQLGVDQWRRHDVTFVAPFEASYLSVRVAGQDMWVHIDDFVLTPSPGVVTVLGVSGAWLVSSRRRFRGPGRLGSTLPPVEPARSPESSGCPTRPAAAPGRLTL